MTYNILGTNRKSRIDERKKQPREIKESEEPYRENSKRIGNVEKSLKGGKSFSGREGAGTGSVRGRN